MPSWLVSSPVAIQLLLDMSNKSTGPSGCFLVMNVRESGGFMGVSAEPGDRDGVLQDRMRARRHPGGAAGREIDDRTVMGVLSKALDKMVQFQCEV